MHAIAQTPSLPTVIYCQADDPEILAAQERGPSVTWHALLIAVPDDWRATGKKSAPPGSTPLLSARAACMLALIQNSERIRNGNGQVRAWTIRLRVCGGSRTMTVAINGLWFPIGPFDIPPAAVQIVSPTKQHMEETLANLNAVCGPGRRFVLVQPLDHAVELLDELPGMLSPGVAKNEAEGTGSPLAEVSNSAAGGIDLREFGIGVDADLDGTAQPTLQTWLQSTDDARPVWQAPEAVEAAPVS